jgi:hypothetical protein
VGLERGQLSLVRKTEELLERTIATPVYKIETNGRGDSLRWPRDTLYPLKLPLTSPTSGGRSVGVDRWRTKPRSSSVFYITTISFYFANLIFSLQQTVLTLKFLYFLLAIYCKTAP